MITGINHFTMSVRDIGESFSFYVDLLGLKPIQKSRTSIYLLAGETWIALVREPEMGDEPRPEYNHLAFSLTPETFEPMKEKLKRAGVRVWQENRTEGDSFYFLDPSGNKLELHVTNLEARIAHGRRHWGDKVQWFIEDRSDHERPA